MKQIYSARPRGHGPDSFFVIASSKEEAIELISAHIDKHYRHKDGSLVYDARGWGTDYYTIRVEKEVATNSNS